MRRKEWFDDEAFWRELYPFVFSNRKFAEAPGEVERVLALTKPTGKCALDLCCGPGRSSIALARRGYAVTGVDRTRFLLARARARARRARVGIEWVERDMRDFVRPEAFDLALSLYTSFGYFDDKADDERVLQNVVASLKPGGAFLIDTVGKEILARIFQPTTSQNLPDGTLFVQRHEVFDDWTRVRNEWTLMRGSRSRTFRFHHTIYSGQELRDRMVAAGLPDVRLYGDLDGHEYGVAAPRLIAVGRKAPSRRGGRRTSGP
jgi:SAM-dependent methyltransferase